MTREITSLYLTPDRIGIETGGGVVTKNELHALSELGPTVSLSGGDCPDLPSDPFAQDEYFLSRLVQYAEAVGTAFRPPDLVHCYSGCLGRTLAWLKERGSKVCYTVAAHDRHVSRQAHERMGYPFPYTHLTDEEQWGRYSLGFRLADALIVPSKHSERVMRREGVTAPIHVIPHGFDPAPREPHYPQTFTVGYMGVVGADKGLDVLAGAWRRLSPARWRLRIAGPGTERLDPASFGPNAECLGRVSDKAAFFDSITCYVQPSWTEGFGIPALEAMGAGRVVVCSKGAGAADIVPPAWRFEAGDAVELADLLLYAECRASHFAQSDEFFHGQVAMSRKYAWPLIRERYKRVWRSLLESPR